MCDGICLIVLPAGCDAWSGRDESRGRFLRPRQSPPLPRADDSIKSIEEEYNQELLRLDHRHSNGWDVWPAARIRLMPLPHTNSYSGWRSRATCSATRSRPPRRLLGSGSPSPTATALAQHQVKIIALSDRGAYDESIESLRQAVAAREAAVKNGDPRAELPTGEIVGICEAYYQRLIHAGHYDTARKALGMILGQTGRPVHQGVLGRPVEAARHRWQAPHRRLQERTSRGSGSTWPIPREKSCWWSSGQAGACPAPPRSNRCTSG